ncbi:6-phosphogluconate dehydrogenase C-terminal domain-like protein [Peniophora sp. CONT]|nr:6-phosphogluconate dehydrogenase C-terminal domain-like protein [Peniophora sp. CONT]
MSAPTIAIIAAGAMGSGVARRLTSAGVSVLTNLDGRSSSTRKRAQDAGMRDTPFAELPRAEIMLSILPPSDAEALAKRYLEAWHSSGSSNPKSSEAGPIYVDCNAVSPKTVKEIASLFEGSGIRFVDAGIIGGPPSEGYDPVFYASADDAAALEAFQSLGQHGLKISSLTGEGVGIGDASALKMSYAGITKGLSGLITTMVLSAHASSPATATALMKELHSSQPLLLKRAVKGIPSMMPKAYRWVGEMNEISDFVGGPMGSVHKGMAAVFERVEQSLDEDGEDKRVLERFVKDAKDLLENDSK